MNRALELFKEICGIPHGSYNIDMISQYLVDFAIKNNLWYRQDEAKNVIIKKKAYPGYENCPGVIIQGHMDMVAVKTEDCKLDLEKDVVKEVFRLAEKHNKQVFAVISNMSIALERRDFFQKLDCFVCNQQEAGILFLEDYDHLSPQEMAEVLSEKIRLAGIERTLAAL